MLDTRKGTILRAIVADYVRTGKPVGSRALATRHHLKVSAATIRNDMAILEELGYINQPHTSAGRIPTDLGYRWFIDNWPAPAWPALKRSERARIASALQADMGDLDETLDSTSHALSEVAEAAALVVSPPTRRSRLRRLELIPRGDRRATLLLIADNGAVEQGIIEFSRRLPREEIEEIARRLGPKIENAFFDELAAKILSVEEVGDGERAALAHAADLVVSSKSRIFTDGASRILSPGTFDDLETAHGVVAALERPEILSEVVEAAKQSRAVLVFVGNEVPIEQMQACAVVFAPYDAGSGRRGTLGVVGPTRMDYPHTISAVTSMAKSLTQLLETLGE